MKKVGVFLVLFVFMIGFAFAANDDDAGDDELVGENVEPLTDSAGCVDTDGGNNVYDAGMVMTWPDITTRNHWLFNWDGCVYPDYEYIEEATCVDGQVKRVKSRCPDGTVCQPFTPFESPVFESFIATWISLMVVEGMTPEEIQTEIDYIRDEWQKAGACVPVEGEDTPGTPIVVIPRINLIDILHGKVISTSKIPFFPTDKFDGKRTRVIMEGEDESRIVKMKNDVLSVSEDNGAKVENTIRIKKKAVERLSVLESEDEINQEIASSFKSGDITFTGSSLKVKFMGFAHKVYSIFN